MRTTVLARIAGVIVALEGVGLLYLAGTQVVALIAGDTAPSPSAIALIVLIVVAAAAVLAFSAAIWRGSSWGRSGAIVTQVLILAVAFGAATGAYAQPVIGILLAVPAVAAFVLLVLVIRDVARSARDDDTR